MIFLLYEFSLSLKLIETFRPIIDIAKYDRRLKCCYKTSIISRNKMVFFLKKTFDDPCPFCKYDLLKKTSSSCLLHNLL